MLNRDLTSAKWMYLKAALFVVIGVMGAATLIVRDPTWQTAVIIALTVWAFARAYYFVFYVIEHYIDGEYRFAGLTAFVRYLMRRRKDKTDDP